MFTLRVKTNYAINELIAGSSYKVNGSISMQSDTFLFPVKSHANVSFNTVHVSLKIAISCNGLNIAPFKSFVASYSIILPSSKNTCT